jgi:hypothetical protein
MIKRKGSAEIAELSCRQNPEENHHGDQRNIHQYIFNLFLSPEEEADSDFRTLCFGGLVRWMTPRIRQEVSYCLMPPSIFLRLNFENQLAKESPVAGCGEPNNEIYISTKGTKFLDDPNDYQLSMKDSLQAAKCQEAMTKFTYYRNRLYLYSESQEARQRQSFVSLSFGHVDRVN